MGKREGNRDKREWIRGMREGKKSRKSVSEMSFKKSRGTLKLTLLGITKALHFTSKI